jgi:integrase/recombinase XerC
MSSIELAIGVGATVPDLVSASGKRAALRYVEFFVATISNRNTRMAYARASERFCRWARIVGLAELGDVTPLHVAAYVEDLRQEYGSASVKQHLAALRMLFDWLVIGHIVESNPTASVRGPKHRVAQGLTPAPAGREVEEIFRSIDVAKASGLRDRALIAVMVFTFARISAALALDVDDIEIRSRRMSLRLLEKGGKAAIVPCQHRLEEYLDAYLEGCGLRGELGVPLFRTISPVNGALQATRLNRKDAYAMVRRRVRAAGIETRIGNHSFRAAGITAFLKNGGTIEKAAKIANHSSTRTTQLYDRRPDEVTLDEVERIILD